MVMFPSIDNKPPLPPTLPKRMEVAVSVPEHGMDTALSTLPPLGCCNEQS
jgi:hypothetical protein